MDDKIEEATNRIMEMFGQFSIRQEMKVDRELSLLYEYAFWAGYREAVDALKEKKAP